MVKMLKRAGAGNDTRYKNDEPAQSAKTVKLVKMYNGKACRGAQNGKKVNADRAGSWYAWKW